MAKRRLCVGPAGVIKCTSLSASSFCMSLFPGTRGYNTRIVEVCRVRELKARFGKRARLALHSNKSPLMRRKGAAVRLVSCCNKSRKE